MSDKSSGIDFDRQAFLPPQRSAERASGLPIIVILVAIVALVFLGYKMLPMLQRDSAGSGDPAVGDIDRRLASIEERLEKLEQARKTLVPTKKEQPAAREETATKPTVRTVYQISPVPRQQVHAAPAPNADVDAAIARRLPAMQQGLASLQDEEAANREAWQATTDRLANVAGQVGTQSVQILQSQDELNQLLARTQMEAIPFELFRGSNPQPVGPVSFVLRSSNPKTRRYTVCVYTEPSCIELKDRTLYEVVQFVVAQNTAPLEVIATKITKNEILGYLEVPRDQSGR